MLVFNPVHPLDGRPPGRCLTPAQGARFLSLPAQEAVGEVQRDKWGDEGELPS
jgi:hypothetical protein